MSYTYKVYSGEDAKVAAKIALKNRLYVSGWDLSYGLNDFINEWTKGFIVLAYDGEIPVGLITGEDNGYVMVFVRKSKRRQGIGTELFKRASEILKEKLHHDTGIPGSLKFFNKVKVQNYGDNWQKILNQWSEDEDDYI